MYYLLRARSDHITSYRMVSLKSCRNRCEIAEALRQYLCALRGFAVISSLLARQLSIYELAAAPASALSSPTA